MIKAHNNTYTPCGFHRFSSISFRILVSTRGILTRFAIPHRRIAATVMGYFKLTTNMRTLIVIFLLLFVTACETKTNQTDKSVTRNELFHAFMKKFKPVDLPYVFRLTNKDVDNVDGLERINPMSTDSLFLKTEYMTAAFCFGYLTDTSKYYTLIFKFAADSYYPVLVTYTKDGEIISQDAILANGCGDDCGLYFWSENAIVSKDFSIFCSDTSRWEYFCDSIGEPIPNSAETWIYYTKGQVKSNGKIVISKTKEIKIKNNP